MSSAMERRSKVLARRLTILGAVCSLAIQPGCARMEAFRSRTMPNAFPMLGARLQSSPAPAPGPDLYAQRLRRDGLSQVPAVADAGAATRPGTYADRVRQANVARNSSGPGALAPAAPLELPGDLTLQLPAEALSGSDHPKTTEPATLDLSPSARSRSGSAIQEARGLVNAGRERLKKVSVYQVLLTRQERVGSVLQPTEDVLLSIRREPKAVRLEWPTGPHKGREVIYTATDPGFMRVNMADLAVPVPPVKLAVDGAQVRSSSRHPISEAGLDGVLDRPEKSLDRIESGDLTADRITSSGPETPKGLDRPCLRVTRVTNEGETWVVELDAESSLPVLVQANAANGELLERYVFREFKADVSELLTATAFDADRRWAHAGGLLGRLARSGSGSAAKATATSATR